MNGGLLDGLRIVVTGANRGLGAALVADARKAGAQVVGTYRVEPPAGPSEVHWVRMDLGVDDAVERGFAEAAERLGGIDAVVANAGVSYNSLLAAADMRDVESSLLVNVGGYVRTLKYAVPHLRSADGGSVVAVSSVMAGGGMPGAGVYSGTKAAIEAITRTAAAELARFGVRVNAVAPGFFDTGMGRAVMDDTRMFERYSSRIPMRRFGSADELSSAVQFLLSPMSTYVTGAVLGVDGGVRL
ncbi:SDR family NAD(P)-dependent oxidoreductase [Nocardia sp. BMG51109]|uniref:SDR family NAD(P)-dependent oxidoreductase n=1 Tax=Nocardia sp. BMG51109 TaxID=1056816 RepID=UPI000466D838|nr:SDR family oxidoreductase [Nocardia sp. BMG51109]